MLGTKRFKKILTELLNLHYKRLIFLLKKIFFVQVAEWKKLLVNISTFSNVLEITGLLLLTIVSSKENNGMLNI